MSISVSGSQITFNDASTQNTSAFTGGLAFRNRIINGAMMIDQRNAGASVTPANGAYTLDRYIVGAQQASKFSVQQNAGSVTPPVGFTKYLGCTSLSSYSVISTDFFEVGQIIEGQNIADLAWGTVSAKTVTLSFQVYSSLTGSFGGNILNSGETRCYPFSYSISSANTWTTISITIPGDTSGTWLTTNGQGMKVLFSLGAGSAYAGPAGAWSGNGYHGTIGTVSVVGTNGATFYITGVQLEKGSTATSFDYRPYSTELALCQRYYLKIGPSGSSGYAKMGFGLASGSSSNPIYFPTPVTMRSTPSVAQSGCASSIGSSNSAITAVSVNGLNQNGVDTTFTCGTYTLGQCVSIQGNANTAAYVEFSAEL